MSKAVRRFSADWVSPGAAVKRQREKEQELDIERKSLVKIMIYSTLKFQILFFVQSKTLQLWPIHWGDTEKQTG